MLQLLHVQLQADTQVRTITNFLHLYFYSFSWRFYPKRLIIAIYVRGCTQLGVKCLAQGHIGVSQWIQTKGKGMCLIHCAITTLCLLGRNISHSHLIHTNHVKLIGDIGASYHFSGCFLWSFQIHFWTGTIVNSWDEIITDLLCVSECVLVV